MSIWLPVMFALEKPDTTGLIEMHSHGGEGG